MHIKMFELAKEKLEENEEYYVIAGFLSPSSDDHVGTKLGDKSISEYHRIMMAHDVANEYDWISISEWECRQRSFVSFGKVTHEIERFIISQINDFKFDIFYVCGGDLAFRTRLISNKSLNVVCIARKEDKKQYKVISKKFQRSVREERRESSEEGILEMAFAVFQKSNMRYTISNGASINIVVRVFVARIFRKSPLSIF